MKKLATSIFLFFLFVSQLSYSNNFGGLENRKAELEQVGIFPNPFTNEFSLKFNSSQAGNVSVRVFDIIGNEILTRTFNLSKSTKEISIEANSELFNSKGIYIVRVVVEGNTYSFRIFKN